MWWSDKILNKPLNKDNGDDNPMLFMLSTMASMHAADDMKIDRKAAAKLFEGKLEDILTRKFEEEGVRGLSLDCDYHPCAEIAEAMSAAQIPAMMAPWKSSTYVKDGHAYGKFGYGKDYVKII